MSQKRIIITGATGGIGTALVETYAKADVEFLLLGRDRDRLATLASIASAAGASETTHSIDVRDTHAMISAIEEFAAKGRVDLLLLSAGVKSGNSQGIEPEAELARVFDVNVLSAIQVVQTVLPHMRAAKRGQIALFSSLAAIAPQADILSYSASKAAIRAYGVALRRELLGSGVSVHVVLPGFVDSPMTDRHLGRTPMKLTAKRAAERIKSGLERGHSTIFFPRTLVWLVRAQNLLPAPLADRIDAVFRAQIVPDDDDVRAQMQDENEGS